MHLVLACRRALLSVHVALEVDEELLQCVDGVTARHIVDVQGGLKDARDVALVLHLLDALGDHLSDFGAHYLRHFAALLPENVCDAFLAELAIDAHVQLEVLVDEQSQEAALPTRQMRVVLRALVQADVGELGLDLFDPS